MQKEAIKEFLMTLSTIFADLSKTVDDLFRPLENMAARVSYLSERVEWYTKAEREIRRRFDEIDKNVRPMLDHANLDKRFEEMTRTLEEKIERQGILLESQNKRWKNAFDKQFNYMVGVFEKQIPEHLRYQDNLTNHEILNTRIEVLGLSVRAENCLTTRGIEFLGQLAQYSDVEVRRWRHLGGVTFRELREGLEKFNLTFGMKFSKWSPPSD